MLLASLFDLAGPDLLIILFFVLVLFGTKKLQGRTRSKQKDEFERDGGDTTEESQPGKDGKLSSRMIAAKSHYGFAAAVGAPFPLLS